MQANFVVDVAKIISDTMRVLGKEHQMQNRKTKSELIELNRQLLEALKAYQTAVASGIDADPALWSRAALLTEAAIAKAEGR